MFFPGLTIIACGYLQTGIVPTTIFIVVLITETLLLNSFTT